MNRRITLLTTFLCLSLAACPGTNSNPGLDHGSSNDAVLDGLFKQDNGPVADFTIKYPEGGTCGPSSCTGCCLPGGTCVAGNADTQCGRNGAWCLNCSTKKSICKLGVCAGCTPVCKGKTCGASDGCSGTCSAGSGCCTPKCSNKLCGVADGCGGTCKAGGGCCTPKCGGVKCGSTDGCGGICTAGSGCCTPSCVGKNCGASDGCSGTCKPGSGCCNASCSGKKCGESDGCTGTCVGPCDGFAECDKKKKSCTCGPSPHYKWVNGVCKASCGSYLTKKGWSNSGMGCCSKGCKGKSSSYLETHDCIYCCENSGGVSACK